MSVHMIKAKFLLLKVSTTTLSPSIYHIKSVHITEAKFLLRKVYYYIETQYLTPWCQYIWPRQSFYCWRSVLLHWVQYLTHEVSTHPWGQASTAKGQYYYNESKYLTPEVSTHHWGQVLLLEVSTTTLSPSIWHHGVSTHDWGKVSTAGGLYYSIESQYLTMK